VTRIVVSKSRGEAALFLSTLVALDTNHVELAGSRGWFLETHGCALKEWARSALLYMQTQWATYCPGSAKHPFAGGPNCSMKRGASFPSA